MDDAGFAERIQHYDLRTLRGARDRLHSGTLSMVRALRIENQWYQHRSGLLDDQLYQAYQRYWRVTAAVYPEWTERMKAHGVAMFHAEFIRDYLDLIDEKGAFLPRSEVEKDDD